MTPPKVEPKPEDATYIPSMSFGKVYLATKGGKKYKDKYPVNWWENDSLFHYPFLLVSAHYGKEDPDFRDRYKIPSDYTVFGDSGGFQKVSQGVSIEPIDILRWMERNVNKGFILDHPPLDFPDKEVGAALRVEACNDREFTLRLQETYNNTKIMVDNKENKQLQLYNILQGHTLERLEEWYNKMNEFQLEGWCISPKPPDYLAEALLGAFIINKGIKQNVHVLGVSGQTGIAISTYLSNYIKNFTFDTASFRYGAIIRVYWLRDFLATFHFKTGNGGEPKFRDLPCDCPVCSNFTIKDLRDDKGWSGELISLHNLYVFIDYTRKMNVLKQDPEIYLDYLKSRHPQVLKGIEIVEAGVEGDMQKAYQLYKEYSKKGTTEKPQAEKPVVNLEDWE